MPKPKITKVDSKAKKPSTKATPEQVQSWKESRPTPESTAGMKPEEKTQQWRNWGKSNPNRVSNAARTLRERKETRTEREEETVGQWRARRPQGGGRGVAAPRAEWVAWGKSKPGRASRAGTTVAAHREANKANKPKTAKKAKKKK